MPTPEEIRSESYTWEVSYADGSMLRELDQCDHFPEIARGRPWAHVFACIDKAQAVSIALYRQDGSLAIEVICRGSEAEPIFYRERIIDARTQSRTNGVTGVGYRVIRDGVTIDQHIEEL